MRILHVYKTYLPETLGGVEQVIYNLCEGTRASGHVADVFVSGPVPALREVQVGRQRVFQARRTVQLFSTPLSSEMMRDLPTLARGYDLIHYHFPWPFADLLQLRLGGGRPYVVTYHSDIVKQQRLSRLYRPLLMNRFLAGAARVVATSETYVASSPVLRSLEHPPAVVPLGIPPPDRPTPDQAPEGPAVRAVLSDPSPFFLFVGVMRYYKGLDVLVRAAAQVQSRVVIAGDGPERGRIEALGQSLGVSNLRFVGPVTEGDKWMLLDRALAFVLPSHRRSEAFGVSLLEAAALYRPLISCEIGTGTSEVDRDSETGLVVPPGDPRALAAAMRKMENDPEAAAAMGNRAARRFAERFTADRMMDGYLAVYEAALAGKGASAPG